MTKEIYLKSPDGVIKPAVYALQEWLSFGVYRSEDQIRDALDSFLNNLTVSLKNNGCKLIGHIKGMLDAGENGHLFFSVTSFEQRAQFKGSLSGKCEKINLTLNVIVFGVDEETIKELVLNGLKHI